jgi:hypothetical protein
LKDQNFTIISVAFDTGGKAAVESWIRPPMPVQIPPELRDIMGWSSELCARAAAPAYPCLIDERHAVAELYNMTNVPMAAWINEEGKIVRPAEPAGATDGFRTMDRSTFKMSPAAAAASQAARLSYVAALRDWVAKGNASEFALTSGAAAARAHGPTAEEALAAAHFRLGQYLLSQGHREEAQAYFTQARSLCPESWHFVRQALELEETGKASGPEFFAAVDALGSRPYYPPLELSRRD